MIYNDDNIINDNNSDLEMKEFAISELDNLKNNYQINEKKIKIYLLPKDQADSKNAIIEIRAGTGGLEASLFASDLFKMYEKVSQKKKWNIEINKKSGNHTYKEPSVIVIYREDQEFNVNELIPTKNNSANKFDLIIASQPYRSRISAEKKSKYVIEPMLKALKSKGKLLTNSL